jgi:glycosyltransferase involved in cell wall biosynthesis
LKAIPLKIRGEGDLLRDVQERASDRNYQIEMVPRLSRQELTHLFQGARFLVWPSEGYYETFGLVAVEAFACGIPVIASRVGVMEEIVRDRVTGLHFKAGDPNDLAEKVKWAWTHPREMETMGREARSEYEVKYTAERNYELLMGVYRRALRGK